MLASSATASVPAQDSISGKISAFDMDWSIGSAIGYPRNPVRFGSSSSQTSQSSGDICRICHCESDSLNPLLTPCYCSGSLKYVHQGCLQQWLTASETNSCELCKFPFIMHTKVKPFNEWRALDMSGIERRRLFCSVLFHFATATCVIWSLCVLIERASEEVKRGLISWPFWTKLVVVAVGLTGGVVFMYIQCKAYLNLCTRWRSRNRILLIQNAPEKVPPTDHGLRATTPMPALHGTTAVAVSATPRRFSHLSGMGTEVSSSATNRNAYSAASHGQIVANIESTCQSGCSRQARDLSANVHLDDLVLHSDVVEEQSSGNAANRDSNVYRGGRHKAPQPSASAIFLENQDILSETPSSTVHSTSSNQHNRVFDETQLPARSKFSRQRHSVWLGSEYETSHNEFRRFSDTKVMADHNIFNVAKALPTPQIGHGGVQPDGQQTVINIEVDPQITDILFDTTEQGSSLDPLELNIQELLELDIRTNNIRANAGATGAEIQGRSSQLSVNSDPQMYRTRDSGQATTQEQKQLLCTPQSLPNLNLSASRENLLQPK